LIAIKSQEISGHIRTYRDIFILIQITIADVLYNRIGI
jgi:hypothetical protein